ncbi:MAG TPA: DNA repair protein RadC [Tenuifilaceae bacterium]|jgi:DNA repair protein RadC|nr:DNA repair protein RadC [Bacteroidales bacterium]HNT41569.1 DNA repair protein RadC [Tenuifilaceae bacterium]HNY09195.1 DNA repair protein RadC [Tenuifilaceae bacterium]HOA09876.1 DNA repair protein RadC [Tenuifilaceae bacterium]HOW21418.1 DNA repair protein RadC [Tenuifilaceae bacterium]
MEQEYKRLTIKDWAVEDRPREKMLHQGIGSLSDTELIAILLRSGNPEETAVELAQRILNMAQNNLNELGKFTIHQLTQVRGVGEAKAITLLAALELGRRRKSVEAINREQITSSRNVMEIFQPLLADLPHEEFWVLLLSRANKVLDRVRVSQGGVTGTVTDVKLIIRAAVEKLASAIIVVHNHPSGNPKPSEKDIAITEKLKQAVDFFDIALLDHLIITDSKCYSFADEGTL